MRLSVQTASLPQWSCAEVVTRLAEQGWDGIEWAVVDQCDDADPPDFWSGDRATWTFAEFVRDPGALLALTREAGLEVACVSTYVMPAEVARVELAFAAAASIGVDRVRLWLPELERADLHDEQLTETRELLGRVASCAARHGVQALLEVHFGTVIPSVSAAKRLVGDLDPAQVAIIHDVGNLVVDGWETPSVGLRMLGAHLAHVHVKNATWFRDRDPERDAATTWQWRFAPLATGQADVRGFMRDLADLGYRGCVSCEDFSRELALETRTRANLALLRDALDAAVHGAT